jgi:menaquinone reductase, iron-sulfur cluster-binding subunit
MANYESNNSSSIDKAVNYRKAKYGMVIDVDRCTGCGACMIACAVENNVAPAPSTATDRTGITPMRVYEADNGLPFPDNKSVFFPISCQQCEHHTPCVSVCPQNAVELDQSTGIVGQIPVRCFGCRYCMVACPYHARYFNWWDPTWPAGMEKTLNPDVSPRMRGVVEKCNFCFHRLQAARSKAAIEGKKDIDPADYVPACVEACPTQAMTFGDLLDEDSEVSKLAKSSNCFRLLENLGTEPKVYFHSEQEWVRKLGESKSLLAGNAATEKESANG